MRFAASELFERDAMVGELLSTSHTDSDTAIIGPAFDPAELEQPGTHAVGEEPSEMIYPFGPIHTWANKLATRAPRGSVDPQRMAPHIAGLCELPLPKLPRLDQRIGNRHPQPSSKMSITRARLA